MKYYFFIVLLFSQLLFADPACEGQKNLQLINEGRLTMEELSNDEVLGVFSALSGRECGSTRDCSSANSACRKECSLRVYVDYFVVHGQIAYEDKCKNACSSGYSACEDEKNPRDKCDEFEDDCKSRCKRSFSTYDEIGEEAIENCAKACSKGNWNCF